MYNKQYKLFSKIIIGHIMKYLEENKPREQAGWIELIPLLTYRITWRQRRLGRELIPVAGIN